MEREFRIAGESLARQRQHPLGEVDQMNLRGRKSVPDEHAEQARSGPEIQDGLRTGRNQIEGPAIEPVAAGNQPRTVAIIVGSGGIEDLASEIRHCCSSRSRISSANTIFTLHKNNQSTYCAPRARVPLCDLCQRLVDNELQRVFAFNGHLDPILLAQQRAAFGRLFIADAQADQSLGRAQRQLLHRHCDPGVRAGRRRGERLDPYKEGRHRTYAHSPGRIDRTSLVGSAILREGAERQDLYLAFSFHITFSSIRMAAASSTSATPTMRVSIAIFRSSFAVRCSTVSTAIRARVASTPTSAIRSLCSLNACCKPACISSTRPSPPRTSSPSADRAAA